MSFFVDAYVVSCRAGSEEVFFWITDAPLFRIRETLVPPRIRLGDRILRQFGFDDINEYLRQNASTLFYAAFGNTFDRSS